MMEQTKVLKALVDKGLYRIETPAWVYAAMKQTADGDLRQPPGGAESLYHLLMRLDLGHWWANQEQW